ncbi:hypothetical protein LIER_22836 [Lithospermum erythrorhizon]|uniref:Uncharacterized protein n=1 Tax=Lithospermum erythrorhizon TaxID=34254 RepID=A0AAV3QV84_LITER
MGRSKYESNPIGLIKEGSWMRNRINGLEPSKWARMPRPTLRGLDCPARNTHLQQGISKLDLEDMTTSSVNKKLRLA